MQPQLIDFWQLAFVGGLAAASLLTWAFAVALWKRRGALLLYEPRRPVPWGPAAMLLAVYMVASTSYVAFNPNVKAEVEEQQDAEDAIEKISIGIAFELTLIGLALAATVVLTRPTAADLGLPPSARCAAKDVLTGVLICLAAYLPVFAVKILVISQTGQPDVDHPMIRVVRENPDPLLLLLAAIFAVVVAPACEEITFRLLLQGALEKWEDSWLAGRVVSVGHGGKTTVGEAQSLVEQPVVLPAESVSIDPTPTPTLRGWIPILVSSTMFSLAHLGHGTDPFPLFVLSLFFGYAYQRTHRIFPSIAAHATFNLFSMIEFARQLMMGGG